MIQDTIHQLSSQRATCKQWSTALAVVILLVGALGHVEGTKLLWAVAPIVFLGLAEAGYSAQERRVLEHLKSRKGNANEQTVLLPREAAGASLWRTIAAATAISIWPFYTGLAAIVAVGGGAVDLQHTSVEAPTNHSQGVVQATVQAKPSSGGCGSGGCGSGGSAGGGCGSGGCGAGAGKACGCSSGSSKVVATTLQPSRPQQQQQYLQTAAGPRALNTVSPNAPGVRVVPPRPAGQPMTQRPVAPQMSPVPPIANGVVLPMTAPGSSTGENVPPQAPAPATPTAADAVSVPPAPATAAPPLPAAAEPVTAQSVPGAPVPTSNGSVTVPKPSNAQP